jgi:hypothetical protein
MQYKEVIINGSILIILFFSKKLLEEKESTIGIEFNLDGLMIIFEGKIIKC